MPALVQRPAPTFKAEAVVDGLFVDISLADYLGQWYVFFSYVHSYG
jgi:peroxiredoxin (alkyl hydroperoxide reductase subunit C)